jgi:CubicO group peptidase (beta-lactamase class C family)
VIDDGKVASVQSFGMRNAKAEPDLAGDERWREITPRMLFTHSAGFGNFHWDAPDGRLRIHFRPGSGYAYSGEGIMLLQFVLEVGLGLNVGRELQRRVFDPLGIANTSLIWRPEFARDLADGWRADGSVEPHDERSRVRAAGSMDTTIADLAKFAAALSRGDGLSKRARAEMTRGSLQITTPAQFPSLIAEAPPERRIPSLAAGLRVIAFSGPQGRGFYKGGHNDSTGNTLVCVDRGRRCVLILANDVRAEAAFPSLVRTIIGETGVPYDWEYPQLRASR